MQINQGIKSSNNFHDHHQGQNAYVALKIPVPIHQQIKKSTRSKASQQSRVSQHSKQHKKSIIKTIFSLSKQKKQERKKFCLICEEEYNQDLFLSIGKCKHLFCKFCLANYTKYKIDMFEEVLCPQEKCKEKILKEGPVYSALDQRFQKKYKKISAYEQVKTNQTMRLCPNEKCEGFISIQLNGPIKCENCKKSFCPKCFMQSHPSACDKYQIAFYEYRLNYRQCPQCKRIIEKIDGCDHMVCTCNCKFCYKCGSKLLRKHNCNSPSTSNISNRSCLDCFQRIFLGILLISVYPFSIIFGCIFAIMSIIVFICYESGIILYELYEYSVAMLVLGVILLPLVIITGIFRLVANSLSFTFCQIFQLAYNFQAPELEGRYKLLGVTIYMFCSPCMSCYQIFQELINRQMLSRQQIERRQMRQHAIQNLYMQK